MKFLGNYCTISSVGNESPKRDVCFARTIPYLTDVLKVTHIYNLWIIKDENYGFNTGYSHNCSLTETQIRSLIKSLKKVYPFTARITNTTLKEEPSYKITININCDNRKVILFILTILRYAYEFPYCMCMKDVFKIYRMPEFRWISLISLANLVYDSVFYDYFGGGHGMSNFGRTANITLKELKTKLPTTKGINELFNQERLLPFRITEHRADTEFWSDEKVFAKRVEVYKKNLKTFIKK